MENYIKDNQITANNMQLNEIQFKKVNEFTWEIPKTGGMKVPAIIYASEALMENIKRDKTLQQSMNVATLNGIIKHSPYQWNLSILHRF